MDSTSPQEVDTTMLNREIAALLQEVDSSAAAIGSGVKKQRKLGQSPRSLSVGQLIKRASPSQLPPISPSVQHDSPSAHKKEELPSPSDVRPFARARAGDILRLTNADEMQIEELKQSSPPRGAAIASTTLGTPMHRADRDMSLGRATTVTPKPRGQLNSGGTVEGWLDDMLRLVRVKASESSEGGGSLDGLKRAGIDRKTLFEAGLDGTAIGRFYQLLFVHSFGMHTSLSELLECLPEGERAQVAVRADQSARNPQQPPSSAVSELPGASLALLTLPVACECHSVIFGVAS